MASEKTMVAKGRHLLKYLHMKPGVKEHWETVQNMTCTAISERPEHTDFNLATAVKHYAPSVVKGEGTDYLAEG